MTWPVRWENEQQRYGPLVRSELDDEPLPKPELGAAWAEHRTAAWLRAALKEEEETVE
ncbi:hypothetical protein OH807_11890 [Kitasatospora sp. NBC_01560]|uniref:hypothetical protein n=1 Tax=Kitasatospora sp. NBC_01560 TaxID=2975965 RepID=UPI0038641F01